MKKTLLFALTLCLAASAEAQIFYLANFNSGSFPSGWSPTDSRILLSNASNSTGYSPPPASAGFNVRFDDCAPVSNMVRLIVNAGISTVNKTNLRVGFGRRKSNAWNNTVSLEWSSNGTSWNLISTDLSPAAPETWSVFTHDLDPAAEGHSNLRFRFTYVTSETMNCTAPPNFRIDDFAVGENFSLPVELAGFEARAHGRHVRLDWTTASETTNDYFAIEHSRDGRLFDEIGRVIGGGTTRAVQRYTFLDERPAPGANYYRLRQVDLDGAFGYSPVRIVEMPGMASVQIFPSPARELLQVKCAEPYDYDAAWQVFDATGRVLVQGILAAGIREISVPLHDFFPGTYFLRLVADRQTETRTFQKY